MNLDLDDLLAILAILAILWAGVTRRGDRPRLDSFDVPPPVPYSGPLDAEHPPADFED